MDRIMRLLAFLYGAEEATAVQPRLEALLREFADRIPKPGARIGRFDERDSVLITYGDMVRRDGEPSLRTLARFLKAHVSGVISGVHLLPFYPYSSDDGFSVIDYLAVNPDLGDWPDVSAFGGDFRLMFDAVINHISRHSAWFQAYREGEAPYRDYFKSVDPATDLSSVFRPRALPLLTPVETNRGRRHVWTTFSDDQMDLNYESPDLLLDVLRVLLTYISHGAELIRLDAIAFMWKVPGTSSLHLPQTHAIIKLMRAVLDEAAPQVALITETNVPHVDNISYFGDGFDEAQMVYNFSLPPLTLDAFFRGDATTLSSWAQTLTLPSAQTTFFNFLASHDGIGVTPARGILTPEAIEAMAARVAAVGGFVSYKNNPDGTQSAYELNVNYLDALAEPERTETDALRARRFLAAQAIMLALRGVPGIYFHSLFGSRGWPEGVEQTGQKRTINREKLTLARLEEALAGGLRRAVFDGLARMLRVRRAEPAFHPHGEQEVLALHPAVFAVRREHDGSSVLCLQNVSAEACRVSLPHAGVELVTGTATPAGAMTLPGYGVSWIKESPRTAAAAR